MIGSLIIHNTMIAPAILFINILIGFISMHLLGIVKKKKKNDILKYEGFFISIKPIEIIKLRNYSLQIR